MRWINNSIAKNYWFEPNILPEIIAFSTWSTPKKYGIIARLCIGLVKITFPILLLRNSVLIATKKQVEKLEKLDLNWSDIFQNQQTLVMFKKELKCS